MMMMMMMTAQHRGCMAGTVTVRARAQTTNLDLTDCMCMHTTDKLPFWLSEPIYQSFIAHISSDGCAVLMMICAN
jgi:hypothetical protein